MPLNLLPDTTKIDEITKLLGYSIEYEVRDKVTGFLSRKPYPFSERLSGDKFLRNGPSRIIRVYPDHPYSYEKYYHVAYYYDGRNRLSRTHIWRHPRINAGNPIKVQPGPAIDCDDPKFAHLYVKYYIDGAEYTKKDYLKKIAELRKAK